MSQCRNKLINDGARIWPRSCQRCGISKCPDGLVPNYAKNETEHLLSSPANAAHLAASIAQATPPAQGSIDVAIPTWQNIGVDGDTVLTDSYARKLMQQEIDALRAVLADRAARQSAAPIEKFGFQAFMHPYIDAELTQTAPAPSEPVPQGVPECAACEDEGMIWVEGCTQACEACQDITDDSEAAPTATSGGEAVALSDEQYQEILRPVLSRKGMQRYLNDYSIELDPSDYRTIIDRARLAPPPLPATDAAPKHVPEVYIREIAETIAMAVGKNASVAPQLCFPHIYLGLKSAFASAPTAQADANPDLLPATFEFIPTKPTPYPPLDKVDFAAIDKQIAVIDAARKGRQERRVSNQPVDLERRSGFDRRARNNGSKA